MMKNKKQPQSQQKIYRIFKSHRLRKVLKITGFVVGCIALLIGGLFTWWSHDINNAKITKDTFADVARLYPTKVRSINKETKEQDLVDIVKDATRTGTKISIAGSQHSQGGHTYYKDAVVLDMKDFNDVVAFDKVTRTITVQSGAQWEQIQNYIAPHGLAVKTMQSSYVFTVGGTLSANAHGRDLDRASVIDTVRSFRLLKSDGTIVTVSRTENPELFKLVIGGYGMFGVILDVTLDLVPDDTYEKQSTVIAYDKFPDYFKDTIQADSSAKMMLVRPNVDVRSDRFLKDFVVSTWHSSNYTAANLHAVKKEKNVLRDKLFFDLSRRFDWAKSMRWSLQQALVEKGGDRYISRNNAMRPPETPLAFLDYKSKNRTDIIQEYYVPTQNFTQFMDDFRTIIQKDDVNIISSTIRYVKASNESYLSYAPKQDAFSIIVMSNIGLGKKDIAKAERTTQKLVNASAKYSGTYYLTYQLFPTTQQLKAAYPNADKVFQDKLRYDPTETFMSDFYAKYAKGETIEFGKK